MASLSELTSEVTARLGSRTDIAARVPVWINDAYYDLLMAPRFSFYELDKQATAATINTLRAYELPSDLWFILDIRDYTSGRKLKQSHWSRFDRHEAVTGTPTQYCRFGDTIELDPTPDGIYQLIIRYRIRPPTLTSLQDMVIGREWDEILTLMAVVKGWEALEQQERAGMQRQLLEDALARRLDVPQLEAADAELALIPRIER